MQYEARTSSLPPRCAWTGARSDRAVRIAVPGVSRFGGPTGPHAVHVLPEHERDLRVYAAAVQRRGRTFFFAMISCALAILAVAAIGGAGMLSESTTTRLVGAIVVLLGVLMFALPFTTPETQQAFGIRGSVRVARAIAAIVVAVGAAIALVV